VHTLAGHKSDVYAVAFAPDNQILLSASGDRTLRLWSLSSSHTPPNPTVLSVESDKTRSNTTLIALAVSPDGQHAATGSSGGIIRIWPLSLDADSPRAEWKAHEDQIYSLRWARAGLVSGSLDKSMKRWDVDMFQEKPEGKSAQVMLHEVRFHNPHSREAFI
jgi:general transcriptional corepressor TUP1